MRDIATPQISSNPTQDADGRQYWWRGSSEPAIAVDTPAQGARR